MSYVCHATNEIVNGEPRVLIPTKIRKVVYIAQTKPDPRSDYMQFAGQTEGWEIVEEVPVRQSKAALYRANNNPVVVKTKEVRFLKPHIKKEKFVRNNYEDFESDKPEE